MSKDTFTRKEVEKLTESAYDAGSRTANYHQGISETHGVLLEYDDWKKQNL